MSKRIYALLGAVVVLGGLYGAGSYLLSRSAAFAVERLKSELPPGATLTYDSLETSLLARKVTAHNLQLVMPFEGKTFTLTALDASAQGIPLFGRDHVRIGRVALKMPELKSGQAVGAAEASLDGLNLYMDHSFSFESGQAQSAYLRGESGPALIEIADLSVGAFKDNVLEAIVLTSSQMHLNPAQAEQRLTIAKIEAYELNALQLFRQLSNPPSLLVRDALGSLKLSDLRVQGSVGGDIAVATLALIGQSAGNGYRKSLQLEVSGVALPLDRAPAETRVAFGLTEANPALPLEVHVAFTHDATTRELKMGTARVTAAGQGDLEAHFTVSGVSSLLLLENPAGAAALSLAGADLRYTDHGLIDRWAKAEQVRLAVNPDVFAEQTLLRLKPSIEALGPRGRQMNSVLYTFLMNPRYLAVQAAPLRPVSLLQVAPLLRAPEKLAELFRLSMTTEAPASEGTATP